MTFRFSPTEVPNWRPPYSTAIETFGPDLFSGYKCLHALLTEVLPREKNNREVKLSIQKCYVKRNTFHCFKVTNIFNIKVFPISVSSVSELKKYCL